MEWFERVADYAWDYFATRPLILADQLASEGLAIIVYIWDWMTLWQ